MELSLSTRFFSLTTRSLLLLLLLPIVCGANGPPVLVNHGGPLLLGNLDLSLLFYGRFGRVQKNIIRNFLISLNYYGGVSKPQVSTWWRMVESYQSVGEQRQRDDRIRVKVVKQEVDASYSVGKVMIQDYIKILVKKAMAGAPPKSIPIIFTSRDVTVQGLCMGKCSEHGVIDGRPYVIVGNPETECPGACAWPFRKSNYQSQGVTLKPPSGDVGADAMVASLASGLAAVVTNPYNTGFSRLRAKSGVMEATTTCAEIFGRGASPGYAGKVLVDRQNGGAFNAHGVSGKKFLLPAIWNPRTSSCWTLL